MKFTSGLSFIFVFLLSQILSESAFAEQVLRWSTISSLHPTQSAVGQLAVEEKKNFLKTLSGSELDKYLKKNAIPVVKGPEGVLFMTDHHHMARGLYELKYDRVLVEVKEDFSDSDIIYFWNKMMDKDYVYLFDENGKEINPSDLPNRIQDMKDDIYRSLSYFVREGGGYEKTNKPFAEFDWAEYFRKRISLFDLKSNWKLSLQRALNMAHCPDAKNLPGFKNGICSR